MKEQRVDSLVQGTQVFSRGMLRGISCVVMTTYLALVAAPAAAAVRQEVFGRPKPLTENSIAQSELAQLREAVRQHRLERQLAARAPETTTDKLKALFTDSPKVKAEKALAETLLGARERLQAEAARQDAEMASTRADLVRKKLPEVILARHDAAVKTIAERRAGFMAELDQLQQADARDDDAQRAALLERLGEKLEAWGGKQQAKTDYKHLPWGSPDSKVRAPHASKLAYQLNLEMFGIKPLRVAGPIPAGTVLPVLPKLPSTPQAADLGETEDIQLTPAIRAKAAELHHNPVEIYRWVHDNIEYIPTYGSIQGADYALQTKRGNAFDTSSLLIGLLRASGIPARYVYGTVEVPMDKAMNWVGGVTNPNAVLELMGQGGIPNIGLTMGGKLVAVRMEHVWVEAFVDFVPSRGVKNRVPDTWVPMDGSYKQYIYASRMDYQALVPIDAQSLVDGASRESSVNDGGGYVQVGGMDELQASVPAFRAAFKDHFDRNPAVTLGEVRGAKRIAPDGMSLLGQVLPLKLVAVAGDFYTLPDVMRAYFNYSFFASEFDRGADNPGFVKRISLPYLAGKSLALSFRPASSNDEALIASYMPAAHADGSDIAVDELPQLLPGYLINVVPELTVDGEVLASSGQVVLGSDVFTQASISTPNSSLSGVVSSNTITAGEYHALAIDGQGTSPAQLANMKSRIEAVNSKIANREIAGLSKHELTGAVLQVVAQYYFAMNDFQDQLSANVSDVVAVRLPSFGAFNNALSTQFSWGLPRQVASAGATMDMDQVAVSHVDKAGIPENRLRFMLVSGVRMSANEHSIPEQIFGLNGVGADGVSAVKALKIAAAQGQKIFSISAANVAAVLPLLTVSPETKAEIFDAVTAGRHVTISQNNISHNGWVGVGYIIVDKETGAGAYKISGGMNGARLVGLAVGLLAGIAVLTVSTVGVGLVLLAASLLIRFLVSYLVEGDATAMANYHGGRLIGLLAGLILTIIFGGYVLISFTPGFVLGLLFLLYTVTRFMILSLFAKVPTSLRVFGRGIEGVA